jgi:hypothetical protein
MTHIYSLRIVPQRCHGIELSYPQRLMWCSKGATRHYTHFPMKTVAFAATTQRVLPSRQLDLTIQHETIREVIPATRRWWFATLG